MFGGERNLRGGRRTYREVGMPSKGVARLVADGEHLFGEIRSRAWFSEAHAQAMRKDRDPSSAIADRGGATVRLL